MGSIPLCVLLHICTAIYPPGGESGGSVVDRIGVNYGRVADNLPEPAAAVKLLSQMSVGTVKLFDANPGVLTAMANSSMALTIMVRNEDILAVAADGGGEAWVRDNVVPFYPATKITVIVVGNEIFSYSALAPAWAALLQAMENLLAALKRRNLDGAIKVTTSVAADVLGMSFPPSAGDFRADIKLPVMKPLLAFLESTGAPFYINLYPYFAWLDNQKNISLDYALFGSAAATVHDGKLRYTNLLDAMVDATHAAMEGLGFKSVQLGISETGWPSAGGDGASVSNAATYNRRLVAKMLRSPGTPRRPRAAIPTFIFALFNENLKPGALTEKNWGLLYPDGRPVYQIDLTGRSSMDDSSSTQPISVAVETSKNKPQQERSWCIAAQNASPVRLQSQLDAACSSSPAACAAIQPGGDCYLPNTLVAHASYAFNSRWRQGSACSFDGAAALTTIDPGYGSCVFA